MTVRAARLCDMTVTRFDSTNRTDSTVPCDKPAVGTCFICDKDICCDHTPHAKGALVVSASVLVGNIACEHEVNNKPQVNTIATRSYHLCIGCKRAIDRLGSNPEQIIDELREAALIGIKAALTAKGLE